MRAKAVWKARTEQADKGCTAGVGGPKEGRAAEPTCLRCDRSEGHGDGDETGEDRGGNPHRDEWLGAKHPEYL